MPFFKASQKLVYFAHVPKCGGSSVEQYLRTGFGPLSFMDEQFHAFPALQQWTRTSAQHILVDPLDRLFPAGFFDAAFAVVRHPVERLISEYHFLRDRLRWIDQSETFSSWIAQLAGAIAKDPWLYDNHLRPMVDFVPKNATVFRLEEGLDQVVGYMDDLVGASKEPLRLERIQARDPFTRKVVPSQDDIATIEHLYRQDFEKFGYVLQTSTVLAAPALNRVHEKPFVTSAPRADRSGLAAWFRDIGITCFLDRDITNAHANFRFCLNCAPNDPNSHAMIANTALRLGALHLAIDHASKALDRQPGNLDVLVAQAGARLRLKHPKARESVEALGPFQKLGDFWHLLRIALAAAEVDDHHEAALFDIAQFLETRPEDVFAGELLTEVFVAFRNSSDEARFGQFVDAVGVLADPNDRPVLRKPVTGQDASVDIIIPVYDAIDDLQACLASIRRWPSAAIQRIILVDDCSSADSAAWLADYRDRHTDVILVRNTENLGFTRAVMAGVGQSSAPYVLFLNSDTLVTAHWLEGMLQAMEAGPHTALVGARPPTERTPDEMAAQVLTITRNVFPRVPFLSGFCLLVHRGAFGLVGGLDSEAFPKGYWEVQDLCLKLTDLGFDSVISDNVYVHHADAGSIASGFCQRGFPS